MQKISIVVPVYNNEKHISRCIESILNQTHKNIELICVDDGSTDGSGKLLDNYAKNDNRIKVIHKENGGVSSARNIGIKEATAAIIAFVDSDDYIQLDMYEKMISIMEKEDLECVCCSYKNIYPDKTVNKRSRFGNQILHGNQIREEIVKGVIGFFPTDNNCLTSVCNRLFVKDILEKNSIWFDEKRNYGEDWLFCIEYYRAIDTIGFIDDCMYFYTHQEDSLSSKARTDYFEYAVKNHLLFNEWFPEFDWNSDVKVKHYNNRPIEAANYYKNMFSKEQSYNLIKEIFFICKQYDYYSKTHGLTDRQKELKRAFDNDDVMSFMKVLQKQDR